jgi:glutathionylspermidine synthase
MAIRVKSEPRPDYKAKLEEQGLTWHTTETGVPYWDETAHWVFTSDEIDRLEQATNDAYAMVLDAVGHVIDNKLLQLFGYDDLAIKLIEKSWKDEKNFTMYGRFDLAYSNGQIKVLEFNGNTPTSLLEASVNQWFWLEEMFPEGDQFNSIHDRLVNVMRKINFAQRSKVRNGHNYNSDLHLTCVVPNDEDQGTVAYFESVIREADANPKFIPITDITVKEEHYNGVSQGQVFIDQDRQPIQTLLALYPWEWLLADDFGTKLAQDVLANRVSVMEPAWKMVASNKRLLATLWELYPYNPLLLPTFTTPDELTGDYVKKPIFGREGQNVTIVENGKTAESSTGFYDDDPFVFQEKTELLQADGNFAVIGSWIVEGESAGMGIRECNKLITDNTARFVPHRFE